MSNIEVRKIMSSESVVCTIGNYPNCDIIRIRGKEISAGVTNFVSLCRKESFEGEIYDKCELAKLIVSY